MKFSNDACCAELLQGLFVKRGLKCYCSDCRKMEKEVSEKATCPVCESRNKWGNARDSAAYVLRYLQRIHGPHEQVTPDFIAVEKANQSFDYIISLEERK